MSKCFSAVIATLLNLLLTPAASLAAQPDFLLKGGERIIFFGDSITASGEYVSYVEAYLCTRFPDKQFVVINHGISSETVSGTSETDHHPPRPDSHKRFTRDVAAWKPNVVIACFGMNDGNYFPFQPERFAKYQEGMRRLKQRVETEAGAKLVLMTSPPYDPYRRGLADEKAAEYGYKFPYIGYDDVLTKYAQWLLSFRDQGLVVADAHAASNEHLRKRRESRASFYLAGDAVHPTPTGHWLMAQTLLLALGAPAECASAVIEAGDEVKVMAGDVTALKRDGADVSFAWTSPLPIPIDPKWDAESIALESVGEKLSRYTLTVRGLDTGTYSLAADGKEVGELASSALEAGVDLMKMPAFPTHANAIAVLRLLEEKRQAVYKDWRERLNTPEAADDLYDPESLVVARTTMEQVRKLCKPKVVEIRLKRVRG